MIDFIIPDWPAPAGIRAVTTLRRGGVSNPPYASLNLADHVGDDRQAVAENRRVLRGRLTDLPSEPVWLSQVHGIRCVSIDDTADRCEADAAVSMRPGAVCTILSADCLPVLLCEETGSVVAAAHAGWRGLASGVLEATVTACGCAPGRLMAWLGPAIGPRAFEVGNDVRAVFLNADRQAASAFIRHGEDGKWLCDLYALARMRLALAGVTRVFGGGHCTYSEAENFYSFRRDGRTGRMATLIWRL